MSAETTVILNIENRHYNPITIYWIDEFESDPALKAKEQIQLDPGDSYLQGSFRGHEWMILDQVNHKLLKRFRARKDESIVIKSIERRLPVKGSTLDVISAAHRPTEPDRNFALDFDGDNDVIIVPSRPAGVEEDLHLGDGDGYQWTLEAWVYLNKEGVEHPIMEKSDAVAGGYSLRIGENGKIQAGILRGTSFVYGEGETILRPRQWYHLAATFNGRTLFKYTDEFEPIWESPSDRYLRNATFYRPKPPVGYVRVGDYCEPGLIDPDQKIDTDVFCLSRRILVAADLTKNAAGVPIVGLPAGSSLDPWTAGLKKASKGELVWPASVDEIIADGISIWRPKLDPADTNYVALGCIVKVGTSLELDVNNELDLSAAPPENSYYLVHQDLLSDTALENTSDWANDLVPSSDLAISEPGDLQIWTVLGSGFFELSTTEDPPVAPPATGAFQSVNAEILEHSYSQFRTYINGQPEETTIHHSRDINSNRTVLDLDGESEHLVLSDMKDQDYGAGMTMECWVKFRHDNPIWRAADQNTLPDPAIPKFSGTYPILELQEKTAEEKEAERAEAVRDLAEENRAQKSEALKSAISGQLDAFTAADNAFTTAKPDVGADFSSMSLFQEEFAAILPVIGKAATKADLARSAATSAPSESSSGAQNAFLELGNAIAPGQQTTVLLAEILAHLTSQAILDAQRAHQSALRALDGVDDSDDTALANAELATRRLLADELSDDLQPGAMVEQARNDALDPDKTAEDVQTALANAKAAIDHVLALANDAVGGATKVPESDVALASYTIAATVAKLALDAATTTVAAIELRDDLSPQHQAVVAADDATRDERLALFRAAVALHVDSGFSTVDSGFTTIKKALEAITIADVDPFQRNHQAAVTAVNTAQTKADEAQVAATTDPLTSENSITAVSALREVNNAAASAIARLVDMLAHLTVQAGEEAVLAHQQAEAALTAVDPGDATALENTRQAESAARALLEESKPSDEQLGAIVQTAVQTASDSNQTIAQVKSAIVAAQAAIQELTLLATTAADHVAAVPESYQVVTTYTNAGTLVDLALQLANAKEGVAGALTVLAGPEQDLQQAESAFKIAEGDASLARTTADGVTPARIAWYYRLQSNSLFLEFEGPKTLEEIEFRNHLQTDPEKPNFDGILNADERRVHLTHFVANLVREAKQVVDATVITDDLLDDLEVKVGEATTAASELREKTEQAEEAADILTQSTDTYTKVILAVQSAATALHEIAGLAAAVPRPESTDAGNRIDAAQASAKAAMDSANALSISATTAELETVVEQIRTARTDAGEASAFLGAIANTDATNAETLDTEEATEKAETSAENTNRAQRTTAAAKVAVKVAAALVATGHAHSKIAAAVTAGTAIAELTEPVFISIEELNSWQHFAISIDDQGAIMAYKNGSPLFLVADAPTVSNSEKFLKETINWFTNTLGTCRNSTDGVSFLRGYMAEFRLWNTVQDHTRIKEFFNREIGTLPGLMSYLPLNEGPQDEYILDYSGIGSHIKQLKEVRVLKAATTDGHFDTPLQDDLNLTFSNDPDPELGIIPSQAKGNLSIELWFRLDEHTIDDLNLLRHGDNWQLELQREAGTSNYRVAFTYRDDGVGDWKFAIQDADQALSPVGKGWTHLLLVYNAEAGEDEAGNLNLRFKELFVDGQFQRVNTGVVAPADSPASESRFRIGAGSGTELAFYLAEIRLWRTLVPPFASLRKRFYQLQDQELADSTLAAYWPLDGTGRDPRDGATPLSWQANGGASGRTAFVNHGLQLNPNPALVAEANSFAPHKWNSRSELRLLPFSIVPLSNNAPLKLGALEPQNSLARLGLLKNTHFEGMMDSVRVWNEPRTPEEIKAVWNQKLTGDEPALVRYYRFDDSIQGDVAVDYRNSVTVEDPGFNAQFGGENKIRNLRLWKTKLTRTELLSHMRKDDGVAGESYADVVHRYIPRTTITDGENNEIKAEGQDEVLINKADHEAAGIDLARIDLKGDFAIELEVKIDTFVLSGKEHYLVFKQDRWALLLYREEGELYFAFTYDYKQNRQQKDWKRIAADRTPVTKRGWVYLAVVGDFTSTDQQIRMYLDRDDRGTKRLDEVKSKDLFELKDNNDFPLQLGEEGKPKWAPSDLLLMDGIHFNGDDHQIKLPAIIANFQKGLCIEAWVFIGPAPDGDDRPMIDAADTGSWFPVVEMGREEPENEDLPEGDKVPSDNVILAIQKGSGRSGHTLSLRIYRGKRPETYQSVSPTVPEGEWVHIAASMDKNGLVVLFQNGQEIPHAVQEPSPVTPWLPRNIARKEGFNFIGRSNAGSLDGAIQHFWGKIDEVRIWRRPRHLKQIQGYMRRELPEVHEALVGMWRFGEGSGIAAYDSTVNGYHGLLSSRTGSDQLPSWVISSNRIDAGLKFQGEGYLAITPELEAGDTLWIEDEDVVSANALTLEAWVRPNSPNTVFAVGAADAKMIELRSSDDSTALMIAYSEGAGSFRLHVQIGETADEVILLPRPDKSKIKVEFGKWLHLAAIIEQAADPDQTDVKLIIHPENANQAIVHDFTLAQPFPNLFAVKQLHLGEEFRGTIDEVRLWNYARSVEQVEANLFCKVDPFDSNTEVLATLANGEPLPLEGAQIVRTYHAGLLTDDRSLKVDDLRTVEIIWRKKDEPEVTVSRSYTGPVRNIYVAGFRPEAEMTASDDVSREAVLSEYELISIDGIPPALRNHVSLQVPEEEVPEEEKQVITIVWRRAGTTDDAPENLATQAYDASTDNIYDAFRTAAEIAADDDANANERSREEILSSFRVDRIDALNDNWGAVRTISSLRIPEGRNIGITWRRKPSAERIIAAEAPVRISRIYEQSTLAAETIYHAFAVTPEPGELSRADIQQHYLIDAFTVGYSASGGMLGYWPMDENTGTIIQDKTANQNHGRFALPDSLDDPANPRLPLWVETSSIQYDGYLFDGRSEFLEIPHHDLLNPTTDFSISAWIEPKRFHGLQGIITKVVDLDNSQFALSLEGEMLRFDYERKGNNYSLVGGKVKDGWNHVAVTVKSRFVNTNELVGNKSDLLRRASAYTRVGRPTTQEPIKLPNRLRVQAGDTLENIRSLTLPISRNVMITWELKDQKDRSRYPIRTSHISYDYEESIDDIYSVFPSTGTRYQISRSDLREFYRVSDIRSSVSTRSRRVKLPKIHLYVNGLLVHSGFAPEETEINGFNINIGAWGGTFRDHFFYGTIDSVAIWNKAISQEVMQRSKENNQFTADHPNVVGFWRPNPDTIQRGVANQVNPQHPRALFGMYDASGKLLRYELRKARELTQPASSIAIGSPALNLRGSAITIEYWFKGTDLGNVLLHEQAANGSKIRSGFAVPSPKDGNRFLPNHHFSNDPDLPEPGRSRALNGVENLLPFDSNLNIQSGEWHHVAVVWERNQLFGYRSYLDGQLIARGPTNDIPLPKIDSPTRIGDNMNGQLAEFRIWSIGRLHNDILRDKNRVLDGDEPGLIAYWPMDDEAPGTVRDKTKELIVAKDLNRSESSSSQLGNLAGTPAPIKYDGQAVNATIIEDANNKPLFLLQELPSVSLSSLLFDGIDDFVFAEDVPNIRLNENFTLEVALQLPLLSTNTNTENPPGGPIVGRLLLDDTFRDDRRPNWKCLLVRDNTVTLGFRPVSGGYFELGAMPIPDDGEWHRIAVTYDRRRSQLQFFLNGRFHSLVNLPSSFRRDDPSSTERSAPITSITIGAGWMSEDITEGETYFRGNIGEVRLWNDIRTPDELLNNFETALKGNESGLEALWRFTQGDGTFVPNEVADAGSGAEVTGAVWEPDSGFRLFGLAEAEEAVVVTEEGKVFASKCLHLDGGNGRLDLGPVPQLKLTGDLTIEAWVYLEDVSGRQTLISKGAGHEFELVFINNKLNYLHYGRFRQEYELEFEAKRWYHIALVRENGVKLIRTYILDSKAGPESGDSPIVARTADSIDVGDASAFRAPDRGHLYSHAPMKASNNALVIGNDPNAGNGLTGRILDVRIWDHPRSGSRIKLFRGRRLRGDELGLLLYHPLGYHPNDLDANSSKSVEVTLEVDSSFTARDFNASITATASGYEDDNADELRTMELTVVNPEVYYNSVNRKHLVNYRLQLPTITENIKQLQITTNLAEAVNNRLRSVYRVTSADFLCATQLPGTGTIPLLAVPDYSLNTIHGVLHNARIDEVMKGANELESGELGAVEVKVRLTANLHPDSFPNELKAVAQKRRNKARIELSLAKGETAKESEIDPDAGNQSLIKVAQSGLRADGDNISIEAAVQNGAEFSLDTAIGNSDPFNAIYTIVFQNTSDSNIQDVSLINVRIDENLERILENPNPREFDISWELVSVENAATPAKLLPPEMTDAIQQRLEGLIGTDVILTGDDRNYRDLVFNPVYDGVDVTELLGLSMLAPRKVATPPFNMAQAARDRRLRRARAERKRQPDLRKFTGPGNNIPGFTPTDNRPAQPNAGAVSELPQAFELTSTVITPVEGLAEGSPESKVHAQLQGASTDGVLTLDQTLLGDIDAAAATATNVFARSAGNAFDLTITGDGHGIAMIKNDQDAFAGFQVVGTLTLLGLDFLLDFTMTKSEEEGWDFTFLFSTEESFNLLSLGLRAEMPELDAGTEIRLQGNNLSEGEANRLIVLKDGDSASIGSLAAAQSYVEQLAAGLAHLEVDASYINGFTEDTDLRARLIASLPASGIELDTGAMLTSLEAEVSALPAQPRPGLHIHQSQPIKLAQSALGALSKRNTPSSKLTKDSLLVTLVHLLAEQQSRLAELMDLNTRKNLPLGFAISTVGVENTKIGPGISVSGAVSLDQLGSLNVVETAAYVDFFLHFNPGSAEDMSYLGEVGINLNPREVSNPVLQLASDVFGVQQMGFFAFVAKPAGVALGETLVGMKAMTVVSTENAELLSIVRSIFGVEQIFLSIEGSKAGSAEPVLEIEGQATIELENTDNPLLRVVHDVLGLKTIDLSMAVDRGGGNDGISMEASGIMNLSDAETAFTTDFLLPFFGVEDATIAVTVAVSKVGKSTSLGVSADISIDFETTETTNPFFLFIIDIFDIKRIDVIIDIDQDAFSLRIDFGLDKEIEAIHRLMKVYIETFMEYRPPTFGIKLGVTFLLDTGSGMITLLGQLGVQVASGKPVVEGMIKMKGDWVNPFGFQGIAMYLVVVELGLTPLAPWISKLGIAAKLRIGKAIMEVAAKIDLANPIKSGFAGQVSNLNVLDVVDTLTGPQNKVPSSLTPVISGIQLDQFRLSVIPDPPLTIGTAEVGVPYEEEGITALADVDLWGFQAAGFMQINYSDGLLAYASLSSLEIIPGVLKIEKGPQLSVDDLPNSVARLPDNGGPELFVKLSPYDTPVVYLQGQVTILDMISRSLAIYISENKLAFITEASLLDLFMMRIEVAVATDFSSMYFKAEMKNDFFAKVREMAVARINELRDAALGELNAAQAEVDKLDDDIEARRRVVQAAFDAATKELRDAKNEVNRKRREVNRLRKKIDKLDEDFDDLHWTKKITKGIPYGIEKAALEATLGIVNGALWLAEQFLEGLARFIQIIPVDLDPILIGLHSAKGLATAGLEIAKLAVEGFAAITTGLLRLALGEFFDIRYAMFETNYSSGIGGTFEVRMKAKIVFLGTLIDIDFYIDLKALENGVKGLVERLMVDI